MQGSRFFYLTFFTRRTLMDDYNDFNEEQEEKDRRVRNLERRIEHLREVLKDAERRGDYYLEFDAREEIVRLHEELRNIE